MKPYWTYLFDKRSNTVTLLRFDGRAEAERQHYRNRAYVTSASVPSRIGMGYGTRDSVVGDIIKEFPGADII